MKAIFFSVLLIYQINSSISIDDKPIYTLDEFFDYTSYSSLSFSPTNNSLIYQTKHPSWDNNTFVHSLWLYDIDHQNRILITDKLNPTIRQQWSPNGQWIALSLTNSQPPTDAQNKTQYEEHIYLYSLVSNQLIPIRLENQLPFTYIWKDDDYSLFVVTAASPSAKKELDDEWKDVIRYREDRSKEIYTIYELNLNPVNLSEILKKTLIRNLSFLISELVYAPVFEKLILVSLTPIIENISESEIYSLHLENPSSLSKLTENEAHELNLQLSIDGTQLFYQTISLVSSNSVANDSQSRLYSVDLVSGLIKQHMDSFKGTIVEYAFRTDGSLVIVGQLGTEVQIYDERSNHLQGWNGTYQSLSISQHNRNILAFVHSSYEKPMEIYLANGIDQLLDAKAITDRNQLFTQRNLPKMKVYQWKNQDDGQIIEGLLHYPPGQFENKNLPLFVLIHGGPYYASVNRLLQSAGEWAPLAATKGWLVLEPNYRGSTGYGDEFMNQLRSGALSLTGKDILYGVDQLIHDGIVDPYRLTVGGYSYGGFLTNWLITQTKRFNAALSGSGSVDHTSTWGTLDIPVFIENLFGGFPWTVPHRYQTESPIFQLDRVSTPTLIVTGQVDVRVPASQSYMLERALYYRGVPVQLLIFPNEGHSLSYNPWHQKIKVREELKWLEKYGHRI